MATITNISAKSSQKMQPELTAKLHHVLRAANFSLTSARRRVFAELSSCGPVTTAQLANQCASTDRATVYRTVNLFERLGVINRIWHGFKHQIELSEIFTPHHHHAVCQNCDSITDIMNSELENMVATLAKQHNFLALQHSIELSGYCRNCQ